MSIYFYCFTINFYCLYSNKNSVRQSGPPANLVAYPALPLAVRYPANVRPCKHGGRLPGISRSDRAAPFPIRSARYREQLTALPLAVRYPANVRPCEHGGHLPGISRKKAANLFRLTAFTGRRWAADIQLFGLISPKKASWIYCPLIAY